jgi:hypothetical protein
MPSDIEQKFDIAVIVPSYKEGAGILPNLEAIRDQIGIEARQVALVLVINNARDAAANVMASNFQTRLLAEKLRSTFPPNIELRIVDRYSRQLAPETCSVGFARKAGGEVILPEMKPEGVLVNTDADTILAPDNLGRAAHHFEVLPNVDIILGNVEMDVEGLGEEARRGTELYTLSWRSRRMFEQIYELVHAAPIKNVDAKISGANFSIRAKVYKAIGGFKEMESGEDAELVLNALKQGFEPSYIQEISAKTSGRNSDRTSKGHGPALARLAAKYEGEYADFPVLSPTAIFAIKNIFDNMELLRKLEDLDEWKKRMQEAVAAMPWPIRLTNKQMNRLFRMSREEVVHNLPDLSIHVPLNMKVVQIVTNIMPRVPLNQALYSAFEYLFEMFQIDASCDEVRQLIDPKGAIWANLSTELLYTSLRRLLDLQHWVRRLSGRGAHLQDELNNWDTSKLGGKKKIRRANTIKKNLLECLDRMGQAINEAMQASFVRNAHQSLARSPISAADNPDSILASKRRWMDEDLRVQVWDKVMSEEMKFALASTMQKGKDIGHPGIRSQLNSILILFVDLFADHETRNRWHALKVQVGVYDRE